MKPLVEAKFCASIELLEQREAQLAAMTAQRDSLLAVCKEVEHYASHELPLAKGYPILKAVRTAIASIGKGQGV